MSSPEERPPEEEGPRSRDGRSESGRGFRTEEVELVSVLGEAIEQAERTLRENLGRRPYAVLGTAAAVGYVVGGGLMARLASRLVVAGGRIAVNAAVEEALARAVGDWSRTRARRKAAEPFEAGQEGE